MRRYVWRDTIERRLERYTTGYKQLARQAAPTPDLQAGEVATLTQRASTVQLRAWAFSRQNGARPAAS